MVRWRVLFENRKTGETQVRVFPGKTAQEATEKACVEMSSCFDWCGTYREGFAMFRDEDFLS